MSIRIITDSASDIPKNLIDKYGIIELPLTIRFGDEEFRDREDMSTEIFFKKLAESKVMPVTSQIIPVSFIKAYQKELEAENSIISIHTSSELSGTYQSAILAKQYLGDEKISVIDSRSATLALGMIVLKAAELAEKGFEHKEIVEKIEAYKKDVKLIVVVNTLENLRRGGRLSDTQAFLGEVLNLKLILTVDNGKVIVIDKVRGEKKALRRVIELMREKGNNISGNVIGIGNVRCPEYSEKLKELIVEEFGKVEFIDANVGCVIAYNVGPGTYGAVFV